MIRMHIIATGVYVRLQPSKALAICCLCPLVLSATEYAMEGQPG